MVIIHTKGLLLQIERRDPLAELSSSLSTRQSAACDGDTLHMECPQATKISIQVRTSSYSLQCQALG